MRFVVPALVSVFISLGLFWGMQLMTSSNKDIVNKSQETHELIYLRDKKETNIQKKKRVPKKKEIKKKIEKFKVVKKFHTKEPKQIKINPLKIQRNIEFSKIASLDGAKILLDANSLTPLKRVNPKYPRRAKMKKQEGFVKLLFDIGKDGFARNVKIMDAKPQNVFEQSCITAIKRWRFRSSEYSQSATITFNFRLAQ